LTTLAVIGFLAYFWKDPAGAADLVRGFFAAIESVFTKIVTFFGAL